MMFSVNPWCAACNALEPEYNLAAKTLSTTDPSLRLAKVDLVKAPKLADRFEIKSYPIGKFFRHGTLVGEYKLGAKKADDITTWLKKRKDGVFAMDVRTTEQIKELASKHQFIVVGFFLASIDFSQSNNLCQ